MLRYERSPGLARLVSTIAMTVVAVLLGSAAFAPPAGARPEAPPDYTAPATKPGAR